MTMFMTDQAENLRIRVRKSEEAEEKKDPSLALRRPRRVVMVTSGKGGVGKTSLAVNLGLALAERSRRVLLMDAHFGSPHVVMLAGLSPRNEGNLSHLLKRERSAEKIMVEGPSGLSILPGCAKLTLGEEFFSRERRRRFVAPLFRFEQEWDYLLIDTAPGTAGEVPALAENCDEILVVTTPEVTSLSDTYSMIKAVHQQADHPPFRLVINRAVSISEAKRCADSMGKMCARFLEYAPRPGGYLLNSSHVDRAVRERTPFVLAHPRSRPARCVIDIAARLLAFESGETVVSSAKSKEAV